MIRATMFKWKKEEFKNSIKYYDFGEHEKHTYEAEEYNAHLENFISVNHIEVNPLYVTAYNLIDRNENVLLKTPSYVEFEPYFTAIMKVKVAKTQKIVLIVSDEEKKETTRKKIHRSFEEYFGFEEIPVIKTLDAYVKQELEKEAAWVKKENTRQNLVHLMGMLDATEEREEYTPEKTPDIVIATPEDVCNPDYVEYVRSITKSIGLIVYYDFSDCVQEEALFAKIIHSVLDYDDEISTLYMADGFFDLEQVVDNFFSKRNLYEIVVPRKPADQSYVMGWKAENINEMQTRTDPDASRNIGTHFPILYDATSYTENDLMIVEDEYDTYAENAANFSHEKIVSRFDCHVGWTNVMGGNSVICTVSDTYNNAAHAYMAMRGIGAVSEYINIVSRPYLLRNYLMYHLRHFSLHPDVLSSYSPGLIKTPRAVSYEALVKAFVIGCTGDQLCAYATAAAQGNTGTPEEMLRALVFCAAGSDETVDPQITKDIYDRYYIDEKTYRQIIDKSGLVDKIEFINNNHVYVRNRREYGYLVPHQKIVLNGIKYTVEKITGNKVELTDSNTREPMYITRAVRTVEGVVTSVEEYGNVVHNSADARLSFRRLISDVKISTYGNILFKDSYHPFFDQEDGTARFEYQKADRKQEKYYQNVNVFAISIGSPLITGENKAELSQLMARLLNEMLPTFFPRHSKRIVIGCSDRTIDNSIEEDRITTRNIIAQMDFSDPKPLDEDEICLYIMEESPVETGLVNVFWQDEEFRYMLRILEDYLYYQEMIKKNERAEIFGEYYKEYLHTLRKILLCVINETYEYHCYDGTLAVDYFNSIRRTRNKFNEIDISRNFHITCDFCGKKIEHTSSANKSYHFYAYSGMVSCMKCYQTAVHTERHSTDDIKVFEDTINGWFIGKYRDRVNSSFYNYLEDAERLSELTDEGIRRIDRYVVTDDMDTEGPEGLASTGEAYVNPWIVGGNEENIGVAVQGECYQDYERASYKVEEDAIAYILIRDGLPHKTYMGVLCHEMTHHWQFANLSWEKLKYNTPGAVMDAFGKMVDLSTYRIEGHAEWERLRYLRAHGGWFKAGKEAALLKNAVTPYGLGYVWMCKMMKVGYDDKRIPVNRTLWFHILRTFYQITQNSFALMRLYFEGEDQKQARKARKKKGKNKPSNAPETPTNDGQPDSSEMPAPEENPSDPNEVLSENPMPDFPEDDSEEIPVEIDIIPEKPEPNGSEDNPNV